MSLADPNLPENTAQKQRFERLDLPKTDITTLGKA